MSNKDVKRKLKDESGKHIDEVLFKWFKVQRAKHIPISDPMLQEKVRKIAEEMGNLLGAFKASNGWLRRLRNPHVIGFRQILNESASVTQSSQMNGNIAFRQSLIGTTTTLSTMRMKQHCYLKQYQMDHSFSGKRTTKEVSIQKNDIPLYFARPGVGQPNSSP